MPKVTGSSISAAGNDKDGYDKISSKMVLQFAPLWTPRLWDLGRKP